MSRSRGAALILVLWGMALLSLLMGSVVACIRLENHQTLYELQRSQALIAAEAGVALVVKDMLSSTKSIGVAGQPYEVKLGNIKLTIQVRSERGKLDLNFCNLELFTRLLQHLGAGFHEAEFLTEGLRKRRVSASPLQFIEELQQATAMPGPLYEHIAPFVTVWTGLSAPDPAFAEPVLRAALGLATSVGPINPGSIMSVHTNVELATGFTAKLDVTLYLTPNDSEQLYRVLRWHE